MDTPGNAIERLNSIAYRHFLDKTTSLPQMGKDVELLNLKFEIETKRKVLEALKELEEGYKLKLDSKKRLRENCISTLEDQVTALKTKSNILTDYIGVLGSHDFLINRQHSEIEEYNKDFFAKLKQITDKTRNLMEDYYKMKKLEERCEDLKQRTSTLMAPAH